MDKPPSWDDVSSVLKGQYTMNFKIPVISWYIDETKYVQPPKTWSKEYIDAGIHQARNNHMLEQFRSYNNESIIDLYKALDNFPIDNKDVVVIGSTNPWIEIICIARNAKSVTTVDYKPPKCDHELIRVIDVDQHKSENILYDCIFSFSSIEHDGLGRYGDPLNPNADIEAVQAMKSKIKTNGLLFLGVPCGLDRLEYNAHRIYGNIRWPILTRSWKEIAAFGGVKTRESFFNTDYGYVFQPWILLTPNQIL